MKPQGPRQHQHAAKDDYTIVIHSPPGMDATVQQFLACGTYRRESRGSAGVFYTAKMSVASLVGLMANKPPEMKISYDTKIP